MYKNPGHPLPTDAPAQAGIDNSVDANPRRHLVVDVLNYLTFFVPVFGGTPASPWVILREMAQRARAFHAACMRTRLVPHYVLDCGSESQEAGRKWRTRRAQEVKNAYKAMPYAIDTALAAALRREGGDVLQAQYCDADDVIMALAVHLGADVLSGDRDMLRYSDVDWTRAQLYSNFKIQHQGALLLFPSPFASGTASPRLARALVLDVDAWRVPQTKMISKMIKDGRILRGNADSFTKAMGNLNVVVRPLRQALYARLGLPFVREEIPAWDAEREAVFWHDDEVPADAALDALLDDPVQAFAWLVQQDDATPPSFATSKKKHLPRQNCKQWRSYARAVIVAEYYMQAQDQAGASMSADELFALAQCLDPCYVPELDLGKTLVKHKARGWRVPKR